MIASFEHRVRYHEVDQQGYLFNSRFLEISDVGLTEFFRALGWPYGDLNASGVDPSVVKVEADFSAPARFDDLLTVTVTCTHVGRSSFGLRTLIAGEAGAVAEIATVYVNVNAAAGTSVPISEGILDALRGALVRAIDDGEAEQ